VVAPQEYVNIYSTCRLTTAPPFTPPSAPAELFKRTQVTHTHHPPKTQTNKHTTPTLNNERRGELPLLGVVARRRCVRGWRLQAVNIASHHQRSIAPPFTPPGAFLSCEHTISVPTCSPFLRFPLQAASLLCLHMQRELTV